MDYTCISSFELVEESNSLKSLLIVADALTSVNVSAHIQLIFRDEAEEKFMKKSSTMNRFRIFQSRISKEI